MAVVDSYMPKRAMEELEAPDVPQRKRFKYTELPLSQSQKSTIDGLVHTMKKRGLYDDLRKKVYAQFENSVC